MKYAIDTSSLKESLNYLIVQGNISKFNRRSCITQITFKQDVIVLNTESSQILSQINLFSKSDSDEEDYSNILFVDSLMFRQLVNSLDSDTIIIEPNESGFYVYSGNSRFTFPKVVDTDEFVLDKPSEEIADYSGATIMFSASNWDYVKNHQLYAISSSISNPVYTYVWIGKDGSVLVGDLDNGIFTHSYKNTLPGKCLLTPSIINLLSILPDYCNIVDYEDSYGIYFKDDNKHYEFLGHIFPKNEDSESVGSYNSDIILSTFDVTTGFIDIDVSKLYKFITQSVILSDSNNNTVTLSYANNVLTIEQGDSKCDISTSGGSSSTFSMDFNASWIKKILSNYSKLDKIKATSVLSMGVKYTDDEAVGLVLRSPDDLTTVIASIE